jgi:hypothetical protein
MRIVILKIWPFLVFVGGSGVFFGGRTFFGILLKRA